MLRLEHEFFRPPVVHVPGQFQVDLDRDRYSGLGQRLAQQSLGLAGLVVGITKDAQCLARVVETGGVLGTDEYHPVEGLFVVVPRQGLEILVDLFAGSPGLVGHLEQFGHGSGGFAGADELGHGPVLDGENLVAQPFGRLGVALLTCLQVVL